MHQGIQMSAVGGYLDEIDACRAHPLANIFTALAGRGSKGDTGAAASSIQQHALARLGVLDINQAGAGQFLRAQVGNSYGREVVPASGALQRLVKTPIEEVTEQKHDRPPTLHPVQEVQGLLDGGATILRLEEQHIADDTQGMASPL